MFNLPGKPTNPLPNDLSVAGPDMDPVAPRGTVTVASILPASQVSEPVIVTGPPPRLPSFPADASIVRFARVVFGIPMMLASTGMSTLSPEHDPGARVEGFQFLASAHDESPPFPVHVNEAPEQALL